MDNLFNSLYEYFEPKKIKCNYELFEKMIKNYNSDTNKRDEDTLIQESINNNELLKILGSKEKFLKGIKEKLKMNLLNLF